MKQHTSASLLVGIVLLLVPLGAAGQGSFQNLDFERATIAPTPIGGGTYPADPAQCFPGWTVGGSGTVVMYNDLSLGAPAISLMGPNFPNYPGYTPLQGSYSVLLQYLNIAGGPPTLSQSGMIPSDAQSINLLVGDGDAVVTLNGVTIPLVGLAGGRWAGDISAFAGTTALLRFSTTTGVPNAMERLYFDDIQFSTQQIPEPDVFALSGLGALLLAWRVQKGQR